MINENSMLYCLIAFIIGYLVYRMTRGNGFSIGGSINDKLDTITAVVDELKTMVTGVEAIQNKYLPAIQTDIVDYAHTCCPPAPPPAAPPA
jgi:hypothetical protein